MTEIYIKEECSVGVQPLIGTKMDLSMGATFKSYKIDNATKSEAINGGGIFTRQEGKGLVTIELEHKVNTSGYKYFHSAYSAGSEGQRKILHIKIETPTLEISLVDARIEEANYDIFNNIITTITGMMSPETKIALQKAYAEATSGK